MSKQTNRNTKEPKNINDKNKSTSESNKSLMEAYYKHIGEAHISNIIKDLDNKKDEIENIEISKPFHNNMMAVINLKKKEEKRKKRIKQLRRISSRAAIVILILIMASTIVTISVEAVRVKVFNWLIESKDKYTEVKVEEETEVEKEGYYLPAYLPEGFILSSNQEVNSMRIIHFSKGDEVIKFVQAQNESSFQLNSEGALKSEVLINESKGMLIINNEIITVFWNINEMSFSLNGRIDKDELIKIAESLEIN